LQIYASIVKWQKPIVLLSGDENNEAQEGILDFDREVVPMRSPVESAQI
jgi:hypothetical protein